MEMEKKKEVKEEVEMEKEMESHTLLDHISLRPLPLLIVHQRIVDTPTFGLAHKLRVFWISVIEEPLPLVGAHTQSPHSMVPEFHVRSHLAEEQRVEGP